MGEGLTFASDDERAAWATFVRDLANPALRTCLERWLGGVRELAMRNASQAMTIAALRDHANAQDATIDHLRHRLASVTGQRK